MTDAALPVTQQAVEQFTESYLTSLGAEITKDGRRWSITLPDDTDTDLVVDGATLEIVDDPNEAGENTLAIAPESPFVERMLDEAAKKTPIGSMSLTGDHVDIQLPSWVAAGSAEAVACSFTPYYDRRAMFVLFHVGLETVSEYQSEELHAVAIDLDSHEERPRLAQTCLELAVGERRGFAEGSDSNGQELNDALDTARDAIESELLPVVEETRERATRAADVELEEYRQFVRQRRDELDDEVDRLTTRIEETTTTIDGTSSQQERVEALRQRKELRAKLDELRDELDDLTTQIGSNFPEKRREIRERHALTVRIRPVTLTTILYERGDLELTLRTNETTVTDSFAYAVGTGVIDDVTCDRCSQQLSTENPLTLDGDLMLGADCCGE